jgi:hypothetical protein
MSALVLEQQLLPISLYALSCAGPTNLCHLTAYIGIYLLTRLIESKSMSVSRACIGATMITNLYSWCCQLVKFPHGGC